MRKQFDCTFLETPPTFVPFVDFKERPQQWKWIGESFLFFSFFNTNYSVEFIKRLVTEFIAIGILEIFVLIFLVKGLLC